MPDDAVVISVFDDIQVAFLTESAKPKMRQLTGTPHPTKKPAQKRRLHQVLDGGTSAKCYSSWGYCSLKQIGM